MSRLVPVLVMSVLFTAIGVVCGYVAGGKAVGAPEPGASTHEDEEHEEDATAVLAPATLRNLGVKVEPAKLTPFVRHMPVPAVVAATPRTRQSVFAPVAGRVRSVDARFGAVVRSGEVVATVVRDPLPRAELVLTRSLIEPASEILHETMALYRKAAVALEIHEAELARLEGISKDDEHPIIPGTQIIQVRYDVRRARRELSALRHQLELHGLGADQIEAVERGESPTVDARTRLAALKHNGLWTEVSEEIYAELSPELRALPWTVATIGEIVAGGFVGREFAAWLRQEKAATDDFLEIGGLLQRGHSLDAVKGYFALGAFDSVVRVKAPSLAADWDVESLLVKPGERVTEGQPLLTLKDPRALYLRVEPTGGETEFVLRALEAGTTASARPLVPGAAPPLEGLRIQKVLYPEAGGAVAYVPVENTPRAVRDEGDGRSFRSWRLGEGQRYLLRIPTQQLPQAYVLPTGAVTDDGPDKVIFLKSGDRFTPVKVEILYQDDEVAVIPPTADIFPGNPVVTAGAFALGLALKSAGEGAGHGHDHVH